MISLQNATINRDAKLLIQEVTLAVYKKMVIGLTGNNGCGKSSLFAVLRGEIEPADGTLLQQNNLQLAAVAQETPAVATSAMDYVIEGDEDLSRILQGLKIAEADEDYETIMNCHNQLHEISGYNSEARAAKILLGLGFSHEELTNPVSSFSGGWRMRLNLAQCLFAPSDLLLLDEPTNHLDMEAIIWLENYLKHYPGGILVISHDRDFLDNITSHIAHIENKTLKLYTGNYSNFEILRAQHIAAINSQHQKQQADIKHKMGFVTRFGAKATKAKQAQSRLKAIEKMALVQPIYDSLPFKFKFPMPKRMPNPMLAMKKADLGYGEKIVIKRTDLSIMPGQRIGLLGVNGAGKSTLIKHICGELNPINGTITRPAHLVIGYFAQHQVDDIPGDATALSLLKDIAPGEYERSLITYLATFNFDRDQSLTHLSTFSGGEKARLALALIIWRQPNLILLDEPTNHLDINMREALTLALQEYTGTLILVSHDRHLMRSLVDELYLVDNGQLDKFDGTVEDYQRLYN